MQVLRPWEEIRLLMAGTRTTAPDLARIAGIPLARVTAGRLTLDDMTRARDVLRRRLAEQQQAPATTTPTGATP